jgi:chemotaxis protein MotB
MKTIKKISLGIVSILLISSCVSSKKYTEAKTESKKCQDQVAASDAKNQKQQQTIEDLQHQITAIKTQLEEKEKELSKNSAGMNEDKKALSDLENAIKREQARINAIREKVCDALKCFTPDELTVKERDGELYVEMYDKLLFPSGSTVVNARGKEALKMLTNVLINNNMKIMVEGHTDAVPIHNKRFNDNWDLSVMRATNVTRVLINDKLNPDRIIASGRSKYDPFDTKSTSKNDKLNRRTDIVLVPKLDELYSMINQDYKLDIKPHNGGTSMNMKNSFGTPNTK